MSKGVLKAHMQENLPSVAECVPLVAFLNDLIASAVCSSSRFRRSLMITNPHSHHSISNGGVYIQKETRPNIQQCHLYHDKSKSYMYGREVWDHEGGDTLCSADSLCFLT